MTARNLRNKRSGLVHEGVVHDRQGELVSGPRCIIWRINLEQYERVDSEVSCQNCIRQRRKAAASAEKAKAEAVIQAMAEEEAVGTCQGCEFLVFAEKQRLFVHGKPLCSLWHILDGVLIGIAWTGKRQDGQGCPDKRLATGVEFIYSAADKHETEYQL